MGVLERVKYSDWPTLVVPVLKPDGTVRVCSDFKVTVNLALHVDQHSVPKAEDLFAMLAAMKNMLLYSDDQKYATINVHLGLFKYTRLSFGITSAQQFFNKL